MGTIPAAIVHTDARMIELVNLEDGYQAIQSVVGGSFEVITSSTGKTTFWINEEGKIMGLPMNPIATALAWELNRDFAAGKDFLAGTVLITGGADDEGETLGLGLEAMEAIQSMNESLKSANDKFLGIK